jgi:hypothetical protein
MPIQLKIPHYVSLNPLNLNLDANSEKKGLDVYIVPQPQNRVPQRLVCQHKTRFVGTRSPLVT